MAEEWQNANTKQELLARIKSEHARLVRLVAGFSDDARLQPLSGELSLKDIIAHITDWETNMLLCMRSAAAGETLPPRVPDGNYARMNAEIYASHKERAWDDVWLDFTRTYEEVPAEVSALSESDLFDPARCEAVMGFAAEGENTCAADFIASDSANHYWEHANEIEAHAATA